MRMKLLTIFFALSALLFSRGLYLSSYSLGKHLKKEQVYDGYKCGGENVSPDLHWRSTLKGVKSFAVTIHDIDASINNGWWHWVVFNIPRNVRTIKKGASNLKLLPYGAKEGRNDYGFIGYGGACPPKKERAHRYVTTLYALDVSKLHIEKGATPFEIYQAIKKHTIAKSVIVSRYRRK